MSAHSSLNHSRSPTPAAAAAAATPPIRAHLSPTNASAMVQPNHHHHHHHHQHHLDHHQISAIPLDQDSQLTTCTAAATTLAVTTIASTSANTINQDFFLFGANEPSFDYPLFEENIKLQLQLQQLRQMRQVSPTNAELTAVANTPHPSFASAIPDSSSPPLVSVVTSGPSPGPASNNSNHNTNPLCTPQTPSLDYICTNTVSNPTLGTASIGTSMVSPSDRSIASFGFDSLAGFLDETIPDAMSMNQHLQHLNLMSDQDNVAFAALLVQQQQQQQQQHVQEQQHHQQHEPLINTPGSPYLQTPFETPYLHDFGLPRFPMDSGCASATIMSLDDSPEGFHHRQGFDTLSLFPEFDFGLLPQPHEPAFRGQHTIAPGTLQMPLPSNDATAFHSGGEYGGNCDTPMSSCSQPESSLASPSVVQDTASHKDIDSDSVDTEDETSSDHSGAPLFSEEEKDETEVDTEDGDDDDDADVDIEDDDDDDYIPSRPLAMAVARFKRKAMDEFQSKAIVTSLSPSSKENLKEECAPSPTKRTRPTLASPSGGKAIIRLRLKSTVAATAIEAPKPKKRRIRKPNPSKLTAPKRFSCPHADCDLQFARLYNLRSHQRTHDPHQVRPFVCSFEECRKAFSRKHDLQRHEAAVHKGERNYGCSICAKPFSRLDGLRRHLSLKSNSPCATQAAGVSNLSANASTDSGDDMDEDIDPGMETGWTAS
ncbi:hypothetical protein BGZ83_009793 [Gryganskiella cystojenkinii]|nr:hypothetical protein BGZ83_009793 [Gryganskiella cystojenkinii]